MALNEQEIKAGINQGITDSLTRIQRRIGCGLYDQNASIWLAAFERRPVVVVDHNIRKKLRRMGLLKPNTHPDATVIEQDGQTFQVTTLRQGRVKAFVPIEWGIPVQPPRVRENSELYKGR